MQSEGSEEGARRADRARELTESLSARGVRLVAVRVLEDRLLAHRRIGMRERSLAKLVASARVDANRGAVEGVAKVARPRGRVTGDVPRVDVAERRPVAEVERLALRRG